MAKQEAVTVDFIRQILDYDLETGLFTWRHRADASRKWNSKWAGKPAGSICKYGYVVIKINGTAYMAHRLAWLHANGSWPNEFLDHKDMVRSNNRLSNLRPCNGSQNKANMRTRVDNRTGLKGVTFMKDRKKWRATLQPISLGDFDCPAAAHFAYVVAADKKYGEFARSN